MLNSYQIVTSFGSNKILTPSVKKHAKSITTYKFLTLYTKLPHEKLKSKLPSIVDFAFKGWGRPFIRQWYSIPGEENKRVTSF